jgi:hypothetical protein
MFWRFSSLCAPFLTERAYQLIPPKERWGQQIEHGFRGVSIEQFRAALQAEGERLQLPALLVRQFSCHSPNSFQVAVEFALAGFKVFIPNEPDYERVLSGGIDHQADGAVEQLAQAAPAVVCCGFPPFF